MRIAWLLALGASCAACASLLSLEDYSATGGSGGSVVAATPSSASTGIGGTGGSCGIYEPGSSTYPNDCASACADAMLFFAGGECAPWLKPCGDSCLEKGDAAAWCTDEYDAFLACLEVLDSAAYECDPEGGAKPRDAVCIIEREAFVNCIQEGPTELSCPEEKCAFACAELEACDPEANCFGECMLNIDPNSACDGAHALILECGYGKPWACSTWPVSGCEQQIAFLTACEIP